MSTKAIEKVIWKATHGVETTSEEDALAYAELEAIRKATRLIAAWQQATRASEITQRLKDADPALMLLEAIANE